MIILVITALRSPIEGAVAGGGRMSHTSVLYEEGSAESGARANQTGHVRPDWSALKQIGGPALSMPCRAVTVSLRPASSARRRRTGDSPPSWRGRGLSSVLGGHSVVPGLLHRLRRPVPSRGADCRLGHVDGRGSIAATRRPVVMPLAHPSLAHWSRDAEKTRR